MRVLTCAGFGAGSGMGSGVAVRSLLSASCRIEAKCLEQVSSVGDAKAPRMNSVA